MTTVEFDPDTRGGFDREYAHFDPEAQTIEVAIIPSGLPRLTSLFPCPQGTETERLARIADIRRSAHIDGFWIVSETRVRNTAFDKRGEATTTKFVVRPCRNDAEARATVALIQGHLDDLAARPSSETSQD